MDQHVVSLLERIAASLEKIAASESGFTAGPHEPKSQQVRETLLQKFEGQYITVDQARVALGMDGSSSKAVGQVVSAAGFERRRWSSGVRFAICEPGGTCVGSPVVLPDNLEDAVAAAREAKAKFGRVTPAQGIIYGAYLMQGKSAKPSQVTEQHVAEVKRLYPEFE
jgi:hypothetical protein